MPAAAAAAAARSLMKARPKHKRHQLLLQQTGGSTHSGDKQTKVCCFSFTKVKCVVVCSVVMQEWI